jgi:hypothetical protein
MPLDSFPSDADAPLGSPTFRKIPLPSIAGSPGPGGPGPSGLGIAGAIPARLPLPAAVGMPEPDGKAGR